jgi:hypothetical protein
MTISILKKAPFLFSMFFIALSFQACDPFGVRATGDDQTLSFDETDFHGLELSIPADVEVRVDSVFNIEVTCEESAMPYLRTEVNNGILKVYFSRTIYDLDHMKILVTAPSWDYFDVSGSGDIEIPDVIEGQKLRMEVSGSGSVRANEAHFDKADLDISGSGELRLAGSAGEMDCNISGSGKIRCFDFLANKADVNVSGSGEVQAKVVEILNAKISGSGSVVYKGMPEVNAQISGSGSVKKF